MRKELGKIKKIYLGYGGYQDAMFGFAFELGGDGWGVLSNFEGAWGIDRNERSEWTEDDRIKQLGEAMMKLKAYLDDAKKQDPRELEGTPVECEFDGNLLKNWRILKEVL